MERLFEDVQYIKGVGPKRSKLLHRLNVENVFDLIWYVPRAYFNRNKTEKIAALQAGQVCSIRGKVVNTSLSRSRRGMSIFKAGIDDGSALITAVWFNQPYLERILKPGQELFLSGRVKNSYAAKEFNVSEYEIMDNEELEADVVPVYALTDGLNQKVMRKLLSSVLDRYLQYYPEILDDGIKKHYKLCDIKFAFYNIHFPSNGENYLQARRRLAFEELLLFKLSIKRERDFFLENQVHVSHIKESEFLSKCVEKIPFQLTSAQQRVVQEIFEDMEARKNMNRMLQGDVGSGKTMVAVLAMAKAVAGAYQAAMMAPTEILAVQHYKYIRDFLETEGVVVACLTGGTPAAERRMILEAVRNGEINIVVGTHALIQDEVKFRKLGLVVIDEQHRFGVRQRALLSQKGEIPDVLVMTATPIPRTLALTVYGDLELSIIDELPPGRKEIKTRFISCSARQQAYNFVREQLSNGSQAYVVCPLVEESEKQDLQAAESLYEDLRLNIYPEFRIGLLHGRMNHKEKDLIMQQFKSGQLDLMVSTTVIEVGVDVSNATIMLIEQAERFGLSQLHQLRGRVGRGDKQSYCLLIGDPKTEEGIRRLQAMERSSDGFELANEDLKIRGPGDFWGVKQHGLTELRIANLIKDRKLIELTAQAVEMLKADFTRDQILDKYIKIKFKKSSEIARN